VDVYQDCAVIFIFAVHEEKQGKGTERTRCWREPGYVFRCNYRGHETWSV